MTIKKIALSFLVVSFLILSFNSVAEAASWNWNNRYKYYKKKPPVVATTTVPLPAIPPVVTAATTSGEVKMLAYTTAYGWPDNSPAGNGTWISGIAGKAGGTGTYNDPITLAVGYVGNKPDFPAGTKFYIPNLKKYFKVGDTCASCHNLSKADKGAKVWVDMWVGGNGSDNKGVISCEEDVTGLHTIIQNPSPNYPVIAGPIFNKVCSKQFGSLISS